MGDEELTFIYNCKISGHFFRNNQDITAITCQKCSKDEFIKILVDISCYLKTGHAIFNFTRKSLLINQIKRNVLKTPWQYVTLTENELAALFDEKTSENETMLNVGRVEMLEKVNIMLPSLVKSELRGWDIVYAGDVFSTLLAQTVKPQTNDTNNLRSFLELFKVLSTQRN